VDIFMFSMKIKNMNLRNKFEDGQPQGTKATESSMARSLHHMCLMAIMALGICGKSKGTQSSLKETASCLTIFMSWHENQDMNL
jgi:hypothetical protein